MATHWGTWSTADRPAEPQAENLRQALAPETVGAFIAWIASAPPQLVLDETIVTPLDEQGYPQPPARARGNSDPRQTDQTRGDQRHAPPALLLRARCTGVVADHFVLESHGREPRARTWEGA